MAFRLPGRLEYAILRSATAATKAERIDAAQDVARFLREGDPLSDPARDLLARLFAGALRPQRGRPKKSVIHRVLFRHDFNAYFALRKAALGMSFDEAIERFAEQRGVKVGTAREWVSDRKKAR